MKKGCFYSHQGWTDIINNLALINYYSKKYDELVVVIRDDSRPILDYYVNGLKNVQMTYVPKYVLDSSLLNIPNEYDILYHGYHDRFRRDGDKYKGRFDEGGMYFVKGFYEFYDIPFSEKVNSFELIRDEVLEDKNYNEFISKYGEDYILYHDDQETPWATGINLLNIFKDVKNAVNLNSITPNLFGYLKVIENAKELHLIDSVWASMCYLIDAKYSTFKEKTINLYSFKIRGGGLMHTYEDQVIHPVHPMNWIIKHI